MTLTTEAPPINSVRPSNEIAIVCLSSGTPELHKLPGQAHLPGSSSNEVALVLGDREEARRYIRSHSEGVLLVLLVHPARQLGTVLKSGVQVQEAIKSCIAEMFGALDLLSEDRRRIFLVDREAAIRQPAALNEALRQYTTVEVPALSSFVATDDDTGRDLYYALAQLCLIEHPQARRWFGEIEASFLPLRHSGAQPVLWERAFRELTHLEDLASQNEILCERLKALQKDFEVVARTEASLNKRSITLLRELSAIEAERNRLLADLAELRSRHDADNQRLTSLISKTEFLRARRVAAEQGNLLLKQQLDSVLGSSSWRITAPLRAISRTLRRLVDAIR